MPSSMTAYGMAFPDLPAAVQLLRPGRGDEVHWRIVREIAAEPRTQTPSEDRLTAEVAFHPLEDGGFVEIDRGARTTRFCTPRKLQDHEVVHPYLATTAVVTALWRGLPALHAGAVSIDGRVFALLGDRGAGKSTAVWSLVRQGCPQVSDDIVIVADGEVLPGPRCLDLRRPAAEHLGVGRELGVLGRRERWRAEVPDELPARTPLAGFVLLDWSGDGTTRCDPVPLGGRIEAIAAAVAARVPRTGPRELLELAALPAVRWSRPRDLAHLDPAATELLSALHSLR